MYAPALLEPNALGQIRSEVQRFAPSTMERFDFDSYCSMQVFLFLEPAASGAVLWDMPSQYFKTEDISRAPVFPYISPEPTISGALLLDSNQLFKNSLQISWDTSLQSLTTTTKKTNLLGGIYTGWTKLFDYIAEFIAKPAVSVMQPEISMPPTADIPELTTPYANLLRDLHENSPWRSWKKLEPLLGTSHTQLQRIAKGTVEIPQDDLATRIDELYRFAKRLTRVSGGDATATTRLLTTRRARDSKSANDFLLQHDYKSAFRAVMDAASPRKALPTIDAVPRRWYDEPSVDLYDDGIEPDG